MHCEILRKKYFGFFEHICVYQEEKVIIKVDPVVKIRKMNEVISQNILF